MATKSPKLFLAFPFPPDIGVPLLHEVKRRQIVPDALVPHHVDDLHVTLAFLGPVMEAAGIDALDAVGRHLLKKPKLAGWNRMTCGTVDVFGSGSAMVLRLSADPIIARARDIALDTAAVRPEGAFRAHVTFAKAEASVTDELRQEMRAHSGKLLSVTNVEFGCAKLGLYRRTRDETSARKYEELRSIKLPL